MSARRTSAVVGIPAVFLLLIFFILTSRRRPGALPEEAIPVREVSVEAADHGFATSDPKPGKLGPASTPASTQALTRRMIRIDSALGRPERAKVRVAFSRDGFKSMETLDLEPDGSGRIMLDLDHREWVAVSIQALGCVPEWKPPVAWSGLDERDLLFALQPAAPVDGSSRWLNGKPMANMRLSFAPSFPPGEYSGIVAARLKMVDEEVTTDANGKFRCTSLRPGDYRVTFPDHPKWPALTVAADQTRSGSLELKVYWQEPSPTKK